MTRSRSRARGRKPSRRPPIPSRNGRETPVEAALNDDFQSIARGLIDLDVTHVRADQLDRRVENLRERGMQAGRPEQLRAQAIELADGRHFACQLCFALF